MTQMADTALSNGRYKLEERLARWPLLADDRLDHHEVPLTHDCLGIMLGAARRSKSLARFWRSCRRLIRNASWSAYRRRPVHRRVREQCACSSASCTARLLCRGAHELRIRP